MSRAASWQVLNQGFANLNNAMATIMRNKEAQRRMDLYEQFGNLDRAYRAQQSAQAQANADRAFNYERERDAQSQKNWELNRQDNLDAKAQAQANWEWDYNQKADIAKAAQEQRNIQNNNAILKDLVSIGDKYGVDVANAYELAQKGDPIAKNMLIAGIGEARKNAQATMTKTVLSPQEITGLVNSKVITPEQGNAYLNSIYKGIPQVEQSTQYNDSLDMANLETKLNTIRDMKNRLDGTYIFSSRKKDEGKMADAIHQLSVIIPNETFLEGLMKSGSITEDVAHKIADIRGFKFNGTSKQDILK